LQLKVTKIEEGTCAARFFAGGNIYTNKEGRLITQEIKIFGVAGVHNFKIFVGKKIQFEQP